MSDTDGLVEDVSRGWWLLALLGVVSIGFGALLIFWPKPTLLAITTLVGLFMIVVGIVRFLGALFDGDREHRWLLAIVGIVGVILGVIVMKYPEATIGVIVLITGLFWLIGGMADIFRGFTGYRPERGTRILFGALSVIFGVVVLVWPEITVGVFAVLMGVYVAFFGVLEVVAAFQVKNA